jgi:rhodanese-related sulfurtransferase
LLAALFIFTAAACTNNKSETGQTGSANAVEAAALKYFADFTSNPVTEWTDLFTMIDAGEEPFIVSIRQQEVYDQGHIKGAYLASWGADLAAKVSKLPTDKPVYVYCYSGQTAGQAIALMRLLGIDAYSVKSGFNYGAMKTEGYENYLETTANELPDAGAQFDAEVLAFVEGYFNAVSDNANFQIAPADADTLIASGDVFFLDIRQAADFDTAHIDGAVNIPFGKGMQERFSELPKDRQIIVACYTGQTAGQTTAVLRALGYNAVSMQFGMNGAKGWSNYIKTTAANNYFINFTGNPMITWEDLFTKIDAGEEPFILSIRQQDVYDEGHIKGAYLASWGADLATKVSLLPTDKPVYVYCYSGQTAGQAVALMRMLGIDAYSVKLGFNYGAMNVEGYESYLETTANELPNAGASYNPFLLAEVANYLNSVADNGNFQIAPADALTMVEAGEVVFVDIRQAADYEAGHVQGAINIPYAQGMQESFKDLPTNQKIIVTCYTGQTAGQTVAVMRMLGYDAV